MLIQAISYNNCQPKNRNTNPNFKGDLGKKVIKDIEALDYDSYEYDSVSKILKNNGVGSMGLSSTSKVKDILHEVALNNLRIKVREQNLDERETSFEKRMKEIQEKLYDKESELMSREKNAEKLFDERNKELDEREQRINEKEELKNQEFSKKEAELEELEQKITSETRKEVTETIRKEEKEKALDDLADKYVEIAKTESDLNKREQALVSAESIMKQGEVEKIKGDLRVLYGIKDENIQSYDSFGEQMIMVSDIFNKHNSALSSAPNPEKLDTVTDILRNNEGSIDKNMLTFIERILNISYEKTTFSELCNLIHISKDKKGNLDLEKSCYIIASLSCKNSKVKDVIGACVRRYSPDSSEQKNTDDDISAWINEKICVSTKWPSEEDVNNFSETDFNKCSKDELIKASKALKIVKLWTNREDKTIQRYEKIMLLSKKLQKTAEEK